MRHAGTGQRKDSRYDFPSAIEYLVDSQTTDEVHRAVTVNISTTGIGAYVFSPHSKGQKIIIKTPLPVHFRMATVRWIKREDASFYLAGLKFIDQSAQP